MINNDSDLKCDLFIYCLTINNLITPLCILCVCVCVTCCVCACVCVSGPRLASRLRMFLSDIWSRTATGGIRAMVAGRRVTSAFMSLSSSSSCFSTEREKEREQLEPIVSRPLWSDRADAAAAAASLPLCRTALAGLFPDMDSLLRCWWDSARHSTSLKRVLRAMEGWEGSSDMLR